MYSCFVHLGYIGNIDIIVSFYTFVHSFHLRERLVTFNNISVIYMTAHRCREGQKKVDLRTDFQRHRYSVVFFVPVQAPTWGHPFYGFSEKPSQFSRLLRRAWGCGVPIFILITRVLLIIQC